MSDDPASKDGLRWEIRRSLIERLRIPWDAMGEMANQQRAEAAIQISTMMDEIEAWRQAVQKADRDIMQLRQQVTDLLGERDEARVSVCLTALPPDYKTWPQETIEYAVRLIAKQQNWDCFEEKP